MTDRKTQLKVAYIGGIFLLIATIIGATINYVSNKNKVNPNELICSKKQGEIKAYIELVKGQLINEEDERRQLNLIYWRDRFSEISNYHCDKVIENDVEINESISKFKSFFNE